MSAANEYPEGSFGYEVERISAKYTALAADARALGTPEGEVAAYIIERARDKGMRRFRDLQDRALARVLDVTR